MMSIRMSGVRRRRFQFRGVKLRKIATKGERKGRFVTGKEGGAYSLPIASVSFFRFSNPQKITCIIFESLFGPYFLPHQSHSYGYAPSSGENLTSKI